MSDLPTREDFEALRQQPFQAARPGEHGTVELKLLEVEALGGSASPHSFRLAFAGPRSLGQGTLELTHPKLGAHFIFLVPVRVEGDGYLYEAIFNLV